MIFRILVGLRWWSKIQPDGSEKWFFESLNIKASNAIDSQVFWTSIYLTPIVWIVFIFISLLSFSFKNLTICLLAFILASTNLAGYRKCNSDHDKKVKGFLMNQAVKNVSAD